MRFTEVIKLAKTTHCSDYSLFHQATYLDLGNARHPFPFCRRGYWQKDSIQVNGEIIQLGLNGACLALVLTYAKKRGNYQEWKNYIHDAEGASVVRGITNIGLLFSEMGTYNSFHLREMCRPLGLDLFDVLKRKNPRSAKTENSSILEMAAREIVYSCAQDRVEYLSIRMNNSGHAMALLLSEGKYKVFDPNLGEFIFKKEGDLITFLHKLFAAFYPGMKRWVLYHMMKTSH
ncbi:hypothetical protein C2125_17945 [Rahnella aquatilis]|nr:YopT-type cysteine protease domain-containing protein [Rahnella aquatilis]RBQ32904.1 hypothetical protein C2125_17945 [Rahnella aquatilis]